MSLSLALSLLRQGNNGDEILSILETIATDESSDPAPTLEEVQF
jgi:hypothetical protein